MLKKNDAINKLQHQREQILVLREKSITSPEFKKWHRDTEVIIEKIFGTDTRHLRDFRSIVFQLGFFSSATKPETIRDRFLKGLDDASSILASMADEVEQFHEDQAQTQPPDRIRQIEHLCERFHLVVRQLSERHDNRPTLNVENEYDVQDLLRCLLYLEFDDVRPEEWTPSYAGGSSRMDFLLRQESIVIEVKKTREGLAAREVGNQLLVDIGRYQSHPNCQTLICFVYDPEGRIANPRGLEMDLTKHTNGIDVRVFIRPTGL